MLSLVIGILGALALAMLALLGILMLGLTDALDIGADIVLRRLGDTDADNDLGTLITIDGEIPGTALGVGIIL